MEIISSTFDGTLNRSWRRRRYRRLQQNRHIQRRNGNGNINRRFWKVKPIRVRLQLKKLSLIRLWIKLKNAYVKMMVRLGGNENVFGSTRSRRTMQNSNGYSMEEFQTRLIYEISKNLFASRELATA